MTFKALFRLSEFKLILVGLILAVPLELVSLLAWEFPAWFFWVRFGLYVLVSTVVGYKIFVHAWRSVVKLNFGNINFLMTIAVVGAGFLYVFEEAMLIVLLFSLSELLEYQGIEHSQSSLKQLLQKRPRHAKIKRLPQNRIEEVPVESVQIGDRVIIKPGDVLPVDGTVLEGTAAVDESTITGEPLPADKSHGDPVFAGTINTTGYLEIEATKDADHSVLKRIIQLTFDAKARKSRTTQFIDRFARIYVPIVILLALGTSLIPPLFLSGLWSYWIYQALTILVIACPCALVLSTPLTIFSAVGNASTKGIIIKGGKYIEQLGNVRAIAFDKTRTLTTGTPRISKVVPFENHSSDKILAHAAGLETYSEHPLAQSVLDHAKQRAIKPAPIKDFQNHPGRGLSGACLDCAGHDFFLGNYAFIKSHLREGDTLQLGETQQRISQLQQEGNTVIALSDGVQMQGLLAIEDTIRPESKSIIDEITHANITPIMLTGDNPETAASVSRTLGIKEFRADLLPEDKSNAVEELKHTFQYVAMVGDGINDAPALARSDVGVVLGNTGLDVVVESADIAILNNRLDAIPFLIRLGRKTAGIIRFNIIFALIVKLIFLSLAVAGMGHLVLAILADVGLTMFVIANSIRLMKFETKSDTSLSLHESTNPQDTFEVSYKSEESSCTCSSCKPPRV